MHRTVSTWAEFKEHWDGLLNFMMEGECIPFDFPMPSIERVIAEVREDKDASIGSGSKGDKLLMDNHADWFRALPIEEAVNAPFSLGHYRLSNFDAPGRMLEGFGERVLEPWQTALSKAGFTWTRCYPILFVSGAGCATNYHMDYSHVMAWQVAGTKRFSGFKEPNRWTTPDQRIHNTGVQRPEGITEADVLAYDMAPGTFLWNCLLTPHWVEAGDVASYSLNISHGGLRLNGQLSPNEQDLDQWRNEHPEDAHIGNFAAKY